jgi:Protein of unknown function (DUF2934)
MKSTPQHSATSKARKTTAADGAAAASAASVRKLDPAQREALIRLAAYSFYERRGFVGGHELEDWLQAEMEVDRQAVAPPTQS